MEKNNTQDITVYTLGHSTHAIDKVIKLLQQFCICTLIDVRSIPYSRRAPQFNLTALSQKLEEEEILYIYAGSQLGGFPNDPTVYHSGKVPEGRTDFAREIDYGAVEQKEWYREGIKRLIEAARHQPTAMMCAEEDPAHCHRQHLIAQTLIKNGIRVKHIRADGSLQEAWEETRLAKGPTSGQPEFF
jgi:uncharacterized protein (DUF488 family)